MNVPIKRAPYAAIVERKLHAGVRLNTYLFSGPDAWRRAADRERSHGAGSAMVLPRGADPATFAWPALPSVLVDASDLDGATLQRLVASLIRAGTRLVAICDAKQADRNVCVRAGQ